MVAPIDKKYEVVLPEGEKGTDIRRTFKSKNVYLFNVFVIIFLISAHNISKKGGLGQPLNNFVEKKDLIGISSLLIPSKSTKR